MDKMSKKEMEALFSKMIGNMKAYAQKNEERIDKQLWQPVKEPLLLKDAIMMRTKYDIDEIRQAYGIQGISQLKKEALSEELARTIPILFDQMLKNLDASIFEIIKFIVDSGGIILADGLGKSTIQMLSKFCFAFSGTIRNQKILYLPVELMDTFKRLDLQTIEKRIAQNTEWVTLINGLLYHFGVMDTFKLNEKLNQYSNEKLSYLDFLAKIKYWEKFSNSFVRRSEIVSRADVNDKSELYKEIGSRTDLSDYPFSRDEVLLAGSNAFIESNAPIEELKELLRTYYGLNEEQIYSVVSPVVMMVKSGMNTMMILDNLKNVIEFPSYKLTKKVGIILMNMNDETRQWLLKGYKPNELYKRPISKKTPIIKIGRNLTCPCGSGKKYKKCCGK